ncbi:MAG: prepilin-type N-terminal cleavage/methylation domain-containing protein [Methylobacter sp.]|jgi:Tfp pilus assembly protein PilV|nr:prepilin-type N-terminal cleavage/methylation domain-containing protein [Methylobacter sp.]
MNHQNRYSRQHGIGLIEVLVATVVIAVGLLATGSLQGKFMASSGQSKTAIQATKLAEAKIEELRNTTTLADFTALASGNDSPVGSNATFTRTWTVTDLTSPTRKKIAVTVTWPPASASETVYVTSQAGWLNPGNSNLYASGAAGGAGVAAKAPDPNQNSSVRGAAPGQPASYSPGTGTALNDGSALNTHTDGTGNLILLNAGGNVLQTFYGGKMNTFKGTVYTVNNFTTNNLTMAVSEDGGYCVDTTFTTNTVSAGKTRNYICYMGGNCKDTTPGTNGCPASPTAAQLAKYNTVGPGGWYGNIGFAGLGVSGGTQEKVCFDVTDFSARGYSTVRTSSGVVTSEGINKSYACHNFLIVDQSGSHSNCATVAADFGLSISPTSIPPTIVAQKITRSLTGTSTAAPNVVEAEDTSACNAVPTHVVTVTVTGATLTAGTLSVTPATGTGSCTVVGSSPYIDYTCTVPDNYDGTLTFGGTTSTGTCSGAGSYIAATSAQTASITATCTATRTVTVTTAQTGTGTVSGITISGTGATCTGLSCTVASTWSGTLTATGTCNGTLSSVSGTSATISSSATTAGITLGTCTAPVTFANCSVTVTGDITKGSNNGDKDVTDNQVSVDSTPGSCTKTATANSGTYSCTLGTVSTGSNAILTCGNKVTGCNTISNISCSSSTMTITGPSLTTK